MGNIQNKITGNIFDTKLQNDDFANETIHI